MVRRPAVALLAALACIIGVAAPSLAQKIDPPRKIKNVDPIYPQDAQAARIQGEVVVEATIGPDGKVSDAKVVGSIPLLDEAALAAVRQWEYQPVIVDGAPKAVLMTVRVKFSLSDTPPPPQKTGPLVLDRDGSDWTVRGTPLLDDNLRFWLHDVMRNDPQKELFVHADAAGRYGELIDVLVSATAAGVERLNVFVGDVGPSEAVRVWLEPLAQKPPGVTLPIADVGLPVKSASTPLVIARTGTTAAAKTGVQRAAAGGVVRLRIDASRKVSDVWDVLTLGKARRIDGFALAVQLPAGAAVAANASISATQQQEWDRLSKAISDLVLSDKPMDATVVATIPMLEKFVTRNPNVADARFKLASAYEYRSMVATASPEAKQRDLKRAVDELARTAELHENADARFLCTWKIARLYSPDQLNDAAQARRYAQRLTEEFPTHAESHILLATMLHDAGDSAGAANVMRHGRTVSTMPLIGLSTSVQYLAEQVKADRRLTPAETRRLLDEALALTDAIIASPEKTDADYQLAAMGKAIVFDLQAERLARTSQERIALLEESERWGPPMDRHKNGAPPPAAKLSDAETRDLERRAVGRWSAQLAAEGHRDEAIAAVAKYSTEHPDMPEPHDQLVDLYLESAKTAASDAGRAVALDRAATELLRLIDLVSPGPEQRYAFERFLDVTGPKNLNRLDRQEPVARAMLKRQPQEPFVHYTLASILLQSGKSGDAEKALRTARSAIKPTAASRAAMAGTLTSIVHRQQQLPAAAARRLFDEAGTLVDEAEKLARGAENVDVIESRMAWLYLSGERFEKDPARAAAQKAEAKRLDERARALRMKEIKES